MNVHAPVLLHETIDGLAFAPGDIFVDGTLGGGGHAREVAKMFGESITIIGIDMDKDALDRGEQSLKSYTSKFFLEQDNFRNLDHVISKLGFKQVTKILLDLGLSSNQLEISDRGFSFQKNEPLLMTFKKDPGIVDLTAKEIVNEWAEETLADIIYAYGEEQFARRIAKGIIEQRLLKPIETTDELVAVIKKSTPAWYHFRKAHPATKTFQALRIAVNDELQTLEAGMKKGFENLDVGGRLAIISFHSLEDRLVKHFFRQRFDEGSATITKKPITATEQELKENPRSRSAKLRILQKIK